MFTDHSPLHAEHSQATLAPSTPHQELDPSFTGLRMLDSADLLQGNKSVNIVHNGQAYRLQATKLGKLILTK